MNRFETLLQDSIESSKRLNLELAERIKFETNLMLIIKDKDKEIAELKEKLAVKNEEEAPLKEYLNDIEKANSADNYLTNGIIE